VYSKKKFLDQVALTTFSSTEEAIAIANDTPYGLGAGVWSRDAHELFQVPRAIAGRVWVNQYNTYPAHAPFGGVKESGFGRENHKMALDHYRVVKNMLISYDKEPVGFF
jgi:aldehyde dehydrogenase (NAD+)/aldehyde dehydrogenase